MPTLFSWNLKAYGSDFCADGIVSDHPRLLEGTYIQTSPLVYMTELEGGILMETRSGRLYHLLPEELTTRVGKPGLPLPDPAALGLSPGFWERCIRSRQQAAEKEAAALRAREAPGTLRLCVVGSTPLSALWRGPEEQVLDVPIRAHTGIHYDSVLISHQFADFRYFPFKIRMEPYKIDAGIETILVVNKGLQPVPLGNGGQEILCPPQETVRIAVTHFNESGFQLRRIEGGNPA